MRLGRTRTLGGAAVAVAGLLCMSASDANAAERNESVVVRESMKLPQVRYQLPPTQFKIGRELTWSRMVLAEDYGWRLASQNNRFRLPTLQGIDQRDDLWLAAPRALTSVASAATSLLTSGISVFDVLRGGRIMQRHSMRAYFKSRGLKLVWRVEF